MFLKTAPRRCAQFEAHVQESRTVGTDALSARAYILVFENASLLQELIHDAQLICFISAHVLAHKQHVNHVIRELVGGGVGKKNDGLGTR